MTKLYLIRRNLESFIGPITLNEMREAHKRMQFGPQDEVSGHCGPWVSLENLDKVKKHYPEVARAVSESMLAGWGVSQPEPVRIAGDETRRLRTRTQRSVTLAFTFFVIAVAAFAAAVYMANSAKLSGKIKEDIEILPEDAQGYVDRGLTAEFDAFMTKNLDEIVRRAVRERTLESPWMPYLRRYAFQREGTIEGLPPKLLRGLGAASAPIDCSLRTWRKRWRLSLKQWPQLVAERSLVREHWARLLAWDPHWVRRRANRGWLPGENYYLGCLTMGDRALAELATDTALIASTSDWTSLGYEQVRQRFAWVLEMVRDGNSRQSPTPSMDNQMSVWNCFEAAKDMPALRKCREGMGMMADAWQAYNEERYGWNLLRIALSVRGTLLPDLQAELVQYSAQVNKRDHFTNFDYRPEFKLFKLLAKPTGPVEKIMEKVQGEFADIRLSN